MGEPGASPTAALVIIGNEILSGRTVDANLAFLGRELAAIGIRMAEVRVVADTEAAIIDAVLALHRQHRYLFTTGGIGPTHDDITAAAVAHAFGRELARNPEAERRLLAYYPREKINPQRMKMADIPPGAELIDNPVSAAPGFVLENVFVLPGVPRIMQAMFDGIRAKLQGGPRVLAYTLVCHAPEGALAARLGEIQAAHPEVEIGSYPFMNFDRPGTSIVFRGTDADAIAFAVRELHTHARSHGIETRDEGLS